MGAMAVFHNYGFTIVLCYIAPCSCREVDLAWCMQSWSPYDFITGEISYVLSCNVFATRRRKKDGKPIINCILPTLQFFLYQSFSLCYELFKRRGVGSYLGIISLASKVRRCSQMLPRLAILTHTRMMSKWELLGCFGPVRWSGIGSSYPNSCLLWPSQKGMVGCYLSLFISVVDLILLPVRSFPASSPFPAVKTGIGTLESTL